MKREIEERLSKLDTLLDQAQEKLERIERTANRGIAEQEKIEERLLRQRKEYVTIERRVTDADALVDQNQRLQGQHSHAKESLQRILELSKTLAKEFRE